jgi:hypothetical protein
MRVRAAQKFSFDHAGDDKIAGVPGPAGYLVGAVNAPDGCADDGEITLFGFQVKTSLLPSSSELCWAVRPRVICNDSLRRPISCKHLLPVYGREIPVKLCSLVTISDRGTRGAGRLSMASSWFLFFRFSFHLLCEILEHCVYRCDDAGVNSFNTS